MNPFKAFYLGYSKGFSGYLREAEKEQRLNLIERETIVKERRADRLENKNRPTFILTNEYIP